MTELTHITQCDDPKYLPLARSRIKAMRATGLRHLSQKFEVDGVQIGVSIDGEHSYISVGGGALEYQAIPKSVELPYGRVSSKDTSLVGINQGRLKYKKEKDRNDGMLDWCSYDGVDSEGGVRYGEHLVTWNCGMAGRYNPVYSYLSSGVIDNFIRVDGEKIDVGMVPYGACRRVETVNGEPKTYIVFASPTSATRVTVNYFIMEEVVGGVAATRQIGAQDSPGPDFFFLQPVFFCGRGEVFATLISSPEVPENRFAQRFKKMTGTVGVDSGGAVSVTFSIQALPRVSHTSAYVNTYVEYIGADVTVDGNICVICQAVVVTSHPSNGAQFSFENTDDDPSAFGHSTWVETLDVNETPLYSYTSTSSRTHIHATADVASYWVYIDGNPSFRQDQTYARRDTTYPADIYHVVTHDIDARYSAYAATVIHEVGGGGTVDWGYFVPHGGSRANWGPVASGVTSGTGDISLVIASPNGVRHSRVYLPGKPPLQHTMGVPYPMPGTDNETLSVYKSGVAIVSRRMASRRHKSFLASTVPWTTRGEDTRGNVGELTSGRVMTVVVDRENIKVSGTAKGALPEGNTEISLEAIHPVY